MSRVRELPPTVGVGQVERCLPGLLESITEHAIVAVDGDGVIQFWNEGARRAHGIPPEQVVGLKTVADLFGPPLPAFMSGTASGSPAGQPWSAAPWEGDVECAHSSGDTFHAHV